MRNIIRLALLTGCLAFTLSSCTSDAIDNFQAAEAVPAAELTPAGTEGDIIPGQYIFTFRSDVIAPAISYLDYDQVTNREEKVARMNVLNAEVRQQIVEFLGREGIGPDQIIATYTSLEAGVALKIDEPTYRRLSGVEGFNAVEHDRMAELPPHKVEKIYPPNAKNSQTLDCAVFRAGASAASPTEYRWIWIIDSGIDMDHPDLNVVTGSPFAAHFEGTSPGDCTGHGTHVAGIAAAIDNSFGAQGVSSGARVVPVRVFDCSGSGPHSTILQGVDHVGTYSFRGDVTNMSVYGHYGSRCWNNTSYRNPVRSLGNSGVFVTMCAGNESDNANRYQPGCVDGNRLYTVASMNCKMEFSDGFSNYNMGPIDFIAVGESVYSTHLGGGYATMSGTSMAAPVVAGICHSRNDAPRSFHTVEFDNEDYPIARR